MKFARLTTLVALVALSIGLSCMTYGQAAGPTGGQLKAAPKRPQARQPVMEAVAKVNPTKDELTKIKALAKTRNENIKAFREAHKGDTQAIREYGNEQQKQFVEGIKGVLTPTQWDQFQVELKKIMDEIKASRQNRQGSQPSPPPAPPKGG